MFIKGNIDAGDRVAGQTVIDRDCSYPCLTLHVLNERWGFDVRSGGYAYNESCYKV